MLAARYGHAAATLNGLIHVVGGADESACSALPTHDVYDPVANAWTTSASMTIARSTPAAAVLNDGTKDLLYVVGGATTCGVKTATMEAYDPVTNTWTSKAPMPGGPRSNMGAAVINGLLYVVGGVRVDTAAGVTTLAEVYNPVSNTWSTIAPMPNARYAMAIGAIDGILYVAGGGSGTVTNFTAVDAYSPATNTWTSKAPLPVLRAYTASTVANGLLYAIGGQNAANLSSIEIYSPATNTWSAGPSLPFARSILPAATVAGAIFVMGGGYDDTGHIVADTFTLSDTIAPTTSATPSIAANANGWNNGDVTVTLQASDGAGGSGVQSIAYFLPGSNNLVAGNSVQVNITAEGITTLTYQATDGAGNVEPLRALTIRIDTTAPLLPSLPNLSAAATSSAGAIVNFWISPWDGGSGISSTLISPLSSGMTFPLGTTHETVTAFDAAGNSTVGGFDVTVNPARPFISVTGGTFTADGNPHPATATAVDQANNPVAGIFNFSYLPGGSAPVAPGRYSATASFTSNNPAFTSAFPWTTMAPDPNTKTSPAVVEIDGKLYVYGFDNDGGGNPTVPRLSIYDTWSNTWTLGASPSLVRAYVSAGTIGGKMYVAGGCVMADCAVGTTNALEIYDPVSNTWSNGPAMPTARFGTASGVIGGKLYVTGGTAMCGPCIPINATEIYNPATNTWTAGVPIPVSRELAAGAAANGRLYVIGGFQRDPGNTLNGAAVGTVHAYDPAANSWSTRSSMPTARFGAAAGVVFGTIYVAGGAVVGATAANERYDPGTDTWTAQLPVSAARYYTSGGVVGSTFYVIDGSDGAALNTNEAFDSSLTTTITINPNDTTPPTTNANFPQPNANGWNRFNVNVFLSAFDSGGAAPPSGVQSITYSLSGAQSGGGTFNTSSTSFAIVNEGTTSVTYHATDNRGNVEADRTFTVKLDKTSPSAANLSNITVNATSPAGAIVTFDLAPSDALSGIDTVSFSQGLPSGSTFPHGNTSENVTITDKAGNSVFRSFNVTVNKTLTSIAVTPATATISLGQGGQQFQATGHFTDGSDLVLPNSGGGSGSGGSFWSVSFSPSLDVSGCANVPGGLSSQAISPIAGVVNNYWGSGNIVQVTGTLTLQQVNLSLACNPSNGSTGSLAATWTGTRYEGTVTSFNGSTSAVVITSGGGGSSLPAVSWQSATPSVAAINSAGFANGNSLGQTTIIASAGGLTCQPIGCATLTVADTTPPNLYVPQQPFVATATSAAGAVVSFGSAVSATDSVDGNITPSCTPSSGTVFPIGSTSVSCQAIDTHLNASPIKTFTVQVNDRLTVQVPSAIVAEATGAAGAAVAFSASATYFLGGSEPVQCFIITGFVGGDPQIGPAVSSGATFPLGTTTVGCQANSATGQHAGGFFTITVQDTTPPVVTTSGSVTMNATSVAGAVATFSASAIDLVDGVRPVTCAPASGSTFAIGVTTVTCSASDASQNTGTTILTVAILSPQQIITNLISQASAANLQQGGNLLRNALQNVAAGNLSTACSQLGAFINQVQAQSGKSLSVADAASLIQSAMDAKAAIGCTG